MEQPTSNLPPPQKQAIHNLYTRLKNWLAGLWQSIAPGPHAWRGAATGVLCAALVLCFTLTYGLYSPTGLMGMIIGLVALALIALLGGVLVYLAVLLLRAVPRRYLWVMALILPLIAMLYLPSPPLTKGFLVVTTAYLLTASLIGAGIAMLMGKHWQKISLIQRIITAAGLLVGLVVLFAGGYWLMTDGKPVQPPVNAAALADAHRQPLTVPDPSLPGSFLVKALIYGSGNDLRRAEFGPGMALKTSPVDGSKLVSGWSVLRSSDWGFNPKNLPLNGRVWYPDGQGSFPLVLLVHGAHFAEDYSDPGYAYLGELLASRGYILVSVDENFLNASAAADLLILSPLEEENDARAWLLLEHLKVWHAWNTDSASPFYQKVDTSQISLIGHSRGGEAVAIAAAFNRLPCYPDDCSLAFDYDYNIRSVVAIAPVDGQYTPADQRTPLENVSYFTLHGSLDMDAYAFLGLRQYERVSFNDGGDWFKAAVYIYGANHGQFNTVWGRKDVFEPLMRLYNTRQLLPPEEQRRIAMVYISAFLEATLRGQSAYRPLFRDARLGRDWLPDTIYLSRYLDSATRLLCSFDGDIDLSSGNLPGVRLSGENLVVWREQLILSRLKSNNRWLDTNNHAAYLGWDTQKAAGTPSFTITLPPGNLALRSSSTLTFALADTGKTPGGEKTTGRSPLDLSIEVVDTARNRARLPLSYFSPLQPPIPGQIAKAGWLSGNLPPSEVIFQTFEFPLSAFVQANPAFDPARLVVIRFVFDLSTPGMVVLDDVGIRE